MRTLSLTILLTTLGILSHAQVTLSIGGGGAFFSADEPLGFSSNAADAPSRNSIMLSIEPAYNINDLARIGVAGHFALQNKFQSFLFGTDFKVKQDQPFYLGIGIGPTRFETYSFNISQFSTPSGNRTSTSEDILTESSFGVAPRIGFRGIVDFNTTFIYVPEFSRGFLLVGLSYILGSHANAD